MVLDSKSFRGNYGDGHHKTVSVGVSMIFLLGIFLAILKDETHIETQMNQIRTYRRFRDLCFSDTPKQMGIID